MLKGAARFTRLSTLAKARNRLKNKNVQMLVYCYVNLRLIKKIEEGNSLDPNNDLEDFLDSALATAGGGEENEFN